MLCMPFFQSSVRATAMINESGNSIRSTCRGAVDDVVEACEVFEPYIIFLFLVILTDCSSINSLFVFICSNNLMIQRCDGLEG